MSALNINAIYRTTEGEGIHIGTPQVFVRFQGCTIGCLNCDSKETWDFSGSLKSLNEVLESIESESVITGSDGTKRRIQRVSITGGDPFHPKHEQGVLELSRVLKSKGYYVNIEAAGTRIVDSIFDIIDFVSFDVKTPSTGVKTSEKLLQRLIDQYASKAQIKSVIADKKDFEFIYDLYFRMGQPSQVPWVLTPCYEPHEEFPRERFISILNWNEEFGSSFRVIGQQHKWIHGPSKLNV